MKTTMFFIVFLSGISDFIIKNNEKNILICDCEESQQKKTVSSQVLYNSTAFNTTCEITTLEDNHDFLSFIQNDTNKNLQVVKQSLLGVLPNRLRTGESFTKKSLSPKKNHKQG